MPTANITASNLNSRYAVKFLKETIDVELEGLTSDLDALDAGTLTGSIDVAGMTEGEHTVNLELNLDSKFKMVNTATVTVDIVLANSIQNSNSNKTDTDKLDTEKEDANKENSEKEDSQEPDLE